MSLIGARARPSLACRAPACRTAWGVSVFALHLDRCSYACTDVAENRHPPHAATRRPRHAERTQRGPQAPATGHRPRATGHRPRATGHRPRATGHRPPATATGRPRPGAAGDAPACVRSYGLEHTSVGAGLGAVPVALNPNVVVWLGDSAPFQAALRITTFGGPVTSVLFHGGPSNPWPAVYVQRTVQPLMFDVLLLRTVTSVWKWPGQLVGTIRQVAAQLLGPGGGTGVDGDGGGGGGGGAGDDPEGVGAGDGGGLVPPGPTPVTSPLPPSNTTSEQL